MTGLARCDGAESGRDQDRMAISLPTSQAALNDLVDWFIPAEIAADREMRKQARMFLISHLFGPFIGNTVPLALYILDPNPGYAIWVLTACITGFWVFPFVLRAIGHYHLLALISIQNLMFCILWSCFFYGGVTSPTLPWVLTIPLLAFFYIGSEPRLRLVVLAMFAANFAVFWAFSLGGFAKAPAMDFAALQGLGLVSTVAASLYVTMMALFYAKVLASQGELEGEMRGHLATAAELRRATEEAERAGAAKADFLAKMSHELRTPLNAVIGYSQLLLEDAADEDDAETAADLERIHSAGHHLLRLVNEILDLSKIEAGKMELASEPVALVPLLEEAVDQHRAAAGRAGNVILTDFDPALGSIICDGSKLRQALLQVLDNAVKFTHGGTIRLIVTRTSRHGSQMASFRVEDTGIGIAREQIATLFEQFTVGDDSSASKYGGTGLGLALSRKLCRLMGGDIVVESQEGVGSAFTVIVPVMPATEDQPQMAIATPDPVATPTDRFGARMAAVIQRSTPKTATTVGTHA
jgi:signal transduction histidine kinase